MRYNNYFNIINIGKIFWEQYNINDNNNKQIKTDWVVSIGYNGTIMYFI